MFDVFFVIFICYSISARDSLIFFVFFSSPNNRQAECRIRLPIVFGFNGYNCQISTAIAQYYCHNKARNQSEEQFVKKSKVSEVSGAANFVEYNGNLMRVLICKEALSSFGNSERKHNENQKVF